MAGLQKSLLAEVTPETLEGHVTTKNFNPLVYSIFFKLKFTQLLVWANLLGEEQRPSSASVCSFESAAPLATRQDMDVQRGTIDPILIARKMDAMDIKEYDMLSQMNPGAKEIFDLIWKDTDYVIEAVRSRLEWIACQIMFHFGYALTSTNNPRGVETIYDIDYGLDPIHTRVVKSANANRQWTNASTALPFTDIEDVVDAGVDFDLKYIFMNKTKFREMVRTESVQKTIFPGAVNLNQTPTPDQVNTYLESQMLPTVMVIDTKVSIENAAGTKTTVDPTLDAAGADKMITFSGTTDLGFINWTTSPEEIAKPEGIIQTKKDEILVSKWAEQVNPVAEMTKGEFHAGLSLPVIGQMYQLNTEANDATGIA